VLTKHPEWIKNFKKRLMDSSDYTNSSSALGELRALGNLLDSGLEVTPIPTDNDKATPEFLCNYEGFSFIIEVHSKQMSGEETKQLREFYESSFKPGQPSIRELVVTPFGKIKKEGDSIVLNAISKICGIKNREHQLTTKLPSVMWLDFQDECWDIVFKPESLLPLRSFRGELVSGEIWYAIYGWKGAPVFEGHTLEKRIANGPLKMGHPGRFRQKTALCAVITSFPRNTSILENPYIEKSLPAELWPAMSMLPWFSVQNSYTKMFSKDLAARIQMEKESIEELESKIIYSW
jgi:hypothetical protein